jgi:hypothetical protein
MRGTLLLSFCLHLILVSAQEEKVSTVLFGQCRIRMFLGLLGPDADQLVRGPDPDPSIIK